MAGYIVPGVYWETYSPSLPVSEFETGVPAFVGYAKSHQRSEQAEHKHPWCHLATWEDFGSYFGHGAPESYMAHAIRGFFVNGGRHCYVMPLADGDEPQKALADGLEHLSRLDAVDLVCAPDIMTRISVGEKGNPAVIKSMQEQVLAHCSQEGDRFAILDAPRELKSEQAVEARRGIVSENGAMYYPWLCVADSGRPMPPCGHVAGIYARTDANLGVFKAPANELVEGVIDLTVPLTDEDQGTLNDGGINCLRFLGGRGVRVWGARTLSGLSDWRYINVRRLFIALGRWIRQYQAHICFEPHTEQLWARIERELTVYLGGLFQRGALKGDTPGQAFYVKCDAETNSSFGREQGYLVTEVGLCPRVPGEFIVVQLFQKPDGIHLVGIPELSRT